MEAGRKSNNLLMLRRLQRGKSMDSKLCDIWKEQESAFNYSNQRVAMIPKNTHKKTLDMMHRSNIQVLWISRFN